MYNGCSGLGLSPVAARHDLLQVPPLGGWPEAVQSHLGAVWTLQSTLLAAEYIDRYINRDQYYPGYHELSTGQFSWRLRGACGQLDIECPLRPGVPTYVLRSHAGGSGIPMLAGLSMIPSAGLLHPGDPEAAHKQAFELA